MPTASGSLRATAICQLLPEVFVFSFLFKPGGDLQSVLVLGPELHPAQAIVVVF